MQLRRSAERGHADHGWLDTFYTFSFADYHDPRFVQFGDLRVLNQDRIAAGAGFPTHPHRDMEIVTWVLEGELGHRDSMGHESKVVPGDAQRMSAGRGIQHSEFNASDTQPLHLLQMWVLPRQRGTEPGYEQRHFPKEGRQGKLQLLVSPEGERSSLRIGQDARLWASSLEPGNELSVEVPRGRIAWLHLAAGGADCADGPTLQGGDALGLEAGTYLLRAREPSELVLWELRDRS